MAGGQQLSTGQGSVGCAITVALVGISLACSQGSLAIGNPHGQQIVISQGQVGPQSDIALTGQSLTASAGTLSVGLRPTNITGQQVQIGAGTVFPSGNNVTVNISGIEATWSQGVIAIGPVFVTGQSATWSQGIASPDRSIPLVGQSATVQQGLVAAGIEADDTFVQTLQGAVTATYLVELVGLEVGIQQGSVSVTGDLTIALTGQVVTVEQGTVGFSNEFELTGQEITCLQYNVGAPGFAELTGQAINVLQGTLFTNEDRTQALTGVQLNIEQGITFASSLAFATGQQINIGQQEIGPRGATLTGQVVTIEQGHLEAPHIDKGAGRSRRGDKTADGKQRRFKVRIDDELFIVSSREEAEELFAQAREMAETQAKQQANAVITGRFNQAKAAGTPISVERIKLDIPTVTPEGQAAAEFAERLRSELTAIYSSAATDAEIALNLQKQRDLDEEESLVLLLLH